MFLLFSGKTIYSKNWFLMNEESQELGKCCLLLEIGVSALMYWHFVTLLCFHCFRKRKDTPFSLLVLEVCVGISVTICWTLLLWELAKQHFCKGQTGSYWTCAWGARQLFKPFITRLAGSIFYKVTKKKNPTWTEKVHLCPEKLKK